MDIKEQLQHLPEPDSDSMNRVWRRFKATRRASASRRSPVMAWLGAGFGMTAMVAAAAAVFVAVKADAPRREVLTSVQTASVERWTDEVELTIEGHGEIAGTGRKAEIHWQSGTVTASVRPHSGNQLSVVTEEALIEVVGTVFSVTRDALGVSTSVERGRVKVTCTGGWSGEIGPEDGAKVCLPVRPGALIGRFNKLRSNGSSLALQLQTLNAGLERAQAGSGYEDQLLLGRLEVYGELGEVNKMRADADAYLARPRSKEVDARQYVSRAILTATNDCKAALPYLAGLEHTGTAVDRVLLAECLAVEQPSKALTLLQDAIPHLDDEWRPRAVAIQELLSR